MTDPLEPRILIGDVLPRLAELPDESVHCVITSPPYWGLRDYGTGAWEGGDSECDHAVRKDAKIESSTLGGGKATTGHQREGFKDACGRCGATRVDHQLGLEATPELFVEKMVAVFREVKRVLRADGTCWLNIGDSYNAYNGNRGLSGSTLEGTDRPDARPRLPSGHGLSAGGLKPKDLVGVPWRLAFALQADGWYLRSDIIWSKPNPMPESVTDRPTKAHEYLFLLTKSARYFYDCDAIREPAEWARWGDQTNGKHEGSESAASWISSGGKAAVRDKGHRKGFRGEGVYTQGRSFDNDAQIESNVGNDAGGHRSRNKRSVWQIATESYAEAHFATFPMKLVEPCILAGTSEKGCCPECGAPWERETEVEYVKSPVHGEGSVMRGRGEGTDVNGWAGEKMPRLNKNMTTLGWKPTCDHHLPPAACTVLDPFLGSGTTALVARRLNRASIGIELNPEYAELARKRLERWWEKPKQSRDDTIDGQVSIFDLDPANP